MNRIREFGKTEGACNIGKKISECSFPAPFASGLEYSSPARGTWNIVHTGMLIPESHQIFVCAQGCLRGVVLTAAELGMSERFSTVAVCENNVLAGDNEELIIEGVSDIIEKLPKKPRAMLIYTSCIHHFLGCDLSHCYSVLRERFPDIKFTDCYMNPIMRKSGITPDARMRQRLYSLLDVTEKDDNKILFAGGDFAIDEENEFKRYLVQCGYEVLEIQNCTTFDDYLELSRAKHCVTTFPSAVPAGKDLAKKHGMIHTHMPMSFDFEEIKSNYRLLSEKLGIAEGDFSEIERKCDRELSELKSVIGDTPIIIDYTAFTRPLSLAILLLKYGFNVTKIYADAFTFEEEKDFEYLKSSHPDIEILPTVHSCMRTNARLSEKKTLAIGQKAAYFGGTEYFVNIVESGGYFGFEGILKLCRDMKEAVNTPKDTRSLIQIKGMGCCGCH